MISSGLPNVLFLLQIPIQDSTLLLVFKFLRLLLVLIFLRFSQVFMILTVLRSTHQVFCSLQTTPQIAFASCFFSHSIGVMCFREKDHRIKMTFSSPYNKDTYYHRDSTVDVDLDYLAEAAFLRFLCCKVTLFLPSHTVFLGRKLLCTAHT